MENRRYNLPHLYLAPPLWVTPLEFRRDLWHQKTTRIALSCGIKNIAGRFFGLVTKHACDRRTDRQNYNSQDRASIAVSRGKKQKLAELKAEAAAVDSKIASIEAGNRPHEQSSSDINFMMQCTVCVNSFIRFRRR